MKSAKVVKKCFLVALLFTCWGCSIMNSSRNPAQVDQFETNSMDMILLENVLLKSPPYEISRNHYVNQHEVCLIQTTLAYNSDRLGTNNLRDSILEICTDALVNIIKTGGLDKDLPLNKHRVGRLIKAGDADVGDRAGFSEEALKKKFSSKYLNSDDYSDAIVEEYVLSFRRVLSLTLGKLGY